VRAYDPDTGVWEELYDSQAAVDEGALPVGAGDAWHANWIDVIDHGEGQKLYVSLCFIDRVLRIDLATRRVDWALGPGGDFAYVGANGPTSCQHGLEVSEDGTKILAYDNGVDRGESRALEYTLDLAARTATVDWTWTDGWYEPLLGDVDWLPNGDVLVTQGHPECFNAEGLTSIVQIDPLAGEERWRMTFPDQWHAAYRSERLDGCALFSNVGACSALEPRWAELAGAFGLE
jgi:Arylsulfotransferase (ASST)